MTEAPGTPERRPGRRRSDLVAVAIVGAIAAALFAGPIYAVTRDDPSATETTSMGDIGGTSVQLGTLQPELAALYEGARTHGAHFAEIPCFCGCMEGRLEHRHLLDCFVLRNGGGWESHAVGCAVCQGEARMALRLLEQGTAVEEVREQIVDEFGMPEEMRDLQEG